MVSITPDHETRKKVKDYLFKLQKDKFLTQTETKSDAFFDMIMNEVNGKTEEGEEKLETLSPVQDSNISSSEFLSQLIAASGESQNFSPVALPTPPITPKTDLNYAQSQAFTNYQYRARFLGQKPYHYGPQSFIPHAPRANIYGQFRPRFLRPPLNLYPQVPFYPSVEPILGHYQNVMSESQFYEYQENLKKQKEYEDRANKRDARYRRSKSRERNKRSRCRSRSRHPERYKTRHRSKSRSRGRHRSRSRSRSRRTSRRSRSKLSERNYKKKSRSRSSSNKKKRTRSKSFDKKMNKTRSRSRSKSLSKDKRKSNHSTKKIEK